MANPSNEWVQRPQYIVLKFNNREKRPVQRPFVQ